LISPPADETTQPQRAIEATLPDRQKGLLAFPHVIGVYLGRVDERSAQLAIRVMLDRYSAAARKALPKMIKGYAVGPEVTGKIQPLNNSNTRAE
jgi:hypothetical protein